MKNKLCMKILEAIILLLNDVPITCWLAIDSRVVVTRIEDYLGKSLQNTGLKGYEFFEKIIQFPFCIPNLKDIQKLNFTKKILEAKELDPKQIYGRLNYLRSEISEITTIFPMEIGSNLTEEKDIFNTLKVVLERMIKTGIYPSNQLKAGYDSFEDVLSMTNANYVLKNVKKLNPNDPKWQHTREQFLHL